MTEQSHTPGPWGDPKKTVLVRGLSFLAHANYETDLGAANARLIAAAPELLEALKLARAELGMIAMHKGLIFPATPQVLAGMAERELSTIDAAIAKATGADQ